MAGNPADLFFSGGAPSASGSTHILINEFGIEADTIWMAPADKPSQRQAVAVVPHAAHYGIYATLSPDGRHVAYTALSPGLKDVSADSPAEVWVMRIDGAYTSLLATDTDLLVAPVWAPDGASLVFRRSQARENAAGDFQLVRVSLDGSETTLIAADTALFPVGFSPDGERLYFTQISVAGTELGQVPADGGPPSLVAHLGDDFTRDWHLSPDGSQLAFLAPQESQAGTVLQAMVTDLKGKVSLQPALPADGRPTQEFNPIWHPQDGDLTLGRLALGEWSAPAVRVHASGLQPLEPPSQGFDVPLSWSPDGSTLVLRSFQGDAMSGLSAWRLVVLSAEGQRREIRAESEISFVGWVSDAE
jgi:Tol biopolymer transport system component